MPVSGPTKRWLFVIGLGCFLLGLIIGTALLVAGVEKQKDAEYEQENMNKTTCVIKESLNFSCSDNGALQYMYKAQIEELCEDELVKSVKDYCLKPEDKGNPYGIDEEVTCYVDSCDGYFHFKSHQELKQTADIFIGIGAGAIVVSAVGLGLCLYGHFA